MPTKKQQDILRLLYRFRFVTSEHLSKALDINKTTINKRLQLLMELEYAGRKYEAEHRLLHKHAMYHLLPKGIDALKRIPDNKFTPSVLRNIRNDQNASGQFIEYCLGVLDIYCSLRARYGDNLTFLTKSQLANRYDYFEDFVPAVYFRLGKRAQKDFFLEYLQSSRPFFTHLRRLKQYADYAEAGDWEAGTESDFPKILFVCDTLGLQKRLAKKAPWLLEDADDEVGFYATTQEQLKSGKRVVCVDLTDPEESLPLSEI